jgi:hypothetical protein
MKRITLFILGVLAVSTSALAQAPAADIEKALLAAPANMREGATVIKWKPDYTYETLRKGTNRLVCFDKSGMPKQQPFMVECTSIANLDRVAQNMKFEAMGDKAQAMFDAAEKDGTRAKPEFGSVWYHVMGPSREQARNHMTIAVPGATTQSLGLPDNNKQGGVWIMNAGTTTAHLMTPGE